MKQIEANEALLELHTMRDWLRWTVSRFCEANIHYGHGTDNAWDESVALVLHGLNLPNDINPDVMDAKLTLSERQRLVELIRERVETRMPLPYITRTAHFAGLAFNVDQRVIIPRSPIAELINKQFSPWLDEQHISSILDLCTGSGCIAIACAHAFPDATVDAIELSADALEVAKSNVERYQLESQVKLVKSDLFSKIKKRKYDIIVANPPYVNITEFSQLPQEYHYEPKMALAAEDDGLAIAAKILYNAEKYLNKNGILVVEVGSSAEALQRKFLKIPFLWLDFEHGGEGVFLLTKQQLKQAFTKAK